MNSAYLVTGLSYGDEGKAVTVDAITRIHGSTLNVRASGGPQCGHNVVLPDGTHHCFAQFGSGSFNQNVRTHLASYMLVEPYAMVNEATILATKGLTDIYRRLSVSPECVVITPWHQMANQIREISRGGERHGSCGMGIGEARSLELKGLALTVGDLSSRNHTAMTLGDIRTATLRSLPTPESLPESAQAIYEEMLNEGVEDTAYFYREWVKLFTVVAKPDLDDHAVIFEGNQGVLLDEIHGTAPYNTWTDCTFVRAEELCREWNIEPIKIGVLRTYSTRHGAGPFPSEDRSVQFPDHNVPNQWQGDFRFGHFDFVAAEYAVRIAQPDCLAITHLDQVTPGNWTYCDSYELDSKLFTTDTFADGRLNNVTPRCLTAVVDSPLRLISERLGRPVAYTTSGPSFENFRVIEAAAGV